MIVGSICSGIGCEAVAWAPLGWRHAFFSEIEPFPRAVLRHRFPDVPLIGDFTKIEAGAHEPIDILVGGTPCQSFSVAGLRGGLSDERGNLALEFCRLARRLGPRWIVWENVPGVLSVDGGRAFGAILGGLAELGYGLAWRVLDAQFVRVDGFPRAVPQRRRRLFVVGHLGDWARAAAVLFERASLSGDLAPRRQAGEGTAHSITSRAGNGSRPAGGTGNLTAFGGNNTAGEIEVATALRAKGGTGHGDFESETFVAHALDAHSAGGATEDGTGRGVPLIAHALTAEGFDASEDGTGRGPPLVAQPLMGEGFDAPSDGQGGMPLVAVADPLSANEGKTYTHEGANNFRLHNVVPVAFDLRGREGGSQPEGPHDTANIRASSGGSSRSYLAFDTTQVTHPAKRSQPKPGDPCHPLAVGAHPPAIASPMSVRRLTPRECERLQGLPDDWTLIPWRGGLAADGPRYRAIGNGMAVNVMRWIGRRIAMVEAVAQSGLERLEAAP